MNDDDTFGAGSYPMPVEEKEKTIKARIYISFDIQCDVPEDWDDAEVYDYIKRTYNDYDCQNLTIDDIDI